MRDPGYLGYSKRSALSRLMSKILRHTPEEFGLSLDDNWCDFEEFCNAVIGKSYMSVTRSNIIYVIKADPKGRFDLVDGRIRATYKHTYKQPHEE